MAVRRRSSRVPTRLVVGLTLASLVVAGGSSVATAGSPTRTGSAGQASGASVERVTPEAATAGRGRYAAHGGAAKPANPSNPLAGRHWGTYTGQQELYWKGYARAKGARKKQLAEIALRPKSKWFNRAATPAQLRVRVKDYVKVSQRGDRDALVQLALFGMEPWNPQVCNRAPNAKDRASYKRWIRAAKRGIGDAHTLILLQPDLLIARCGPRGGAGVASLVAWASRTLHGGNRSVYIDAGAYDWPHPSQGGAGAAASYLMKSGIRSARGFALNGTHYSRTPLEVKRAAALSKELARRGAKGKKAIISTTSNGAGFEFGKYQPQSQRDNARTCTTKRPKQHCVMLGIPPGTDVDRPQWGLNKGDRQRARTYVDGYVWFGRPWLYNQAAPYVERRALDLARHWRLKPRG